MSTAERSMGLGLRALNHLAGSDLLDRAGLRKPVERSVFQGTRRGFRTAGAASRRFNAVSRLARPARQAASARPSCLTSRPTMSSRCCARRSGRSRPSRSVPQRSSPTAHAQRRRSFSALATELGLGDARRPRGARRRRWPSARRSPSVLVAEALAHGDLGIAFAALAPSAVAPQWVCGATASSSPPICRLRLRDAPAAALALLEPRPLFDPMRLETRARADREGGP